MRQLRFAPVCSRLYQAGLDGGLRLCHRAHLRLCPAFWGRRFLNKIIFSISYIAARVAIAHGGYRRYTSYVVSYFILQSYGHELCIRENAVVGDDGRWSERGA